VFDSAVTSVNRTLQADANAPVAAPRQKRGQTGSIRH
jgi:hypothetical protein